MNDQNAWKGTDRGQLLLIALIVVAFVASLVMLFTDNTGALKLALIAALWAALLGSFLVYRSRQAVDAKDAELEHQRELAHSRVLAGEGTPSQELELLHEMRARESEVLADIQRELKALRAQLEELSGREFGYEPASLRAEARRILELEEAAAVAATPEPEPEPEPYESPLPDFSHVHTGPPSSDAVAGRLGQQETPSRPIPNPLAELIAENQRREQEQTRAFSTGSFEAVSWDQGGVHRSEVEPPEEEPVTPTYVGRHGAGFNFAAEEPEVAEVPEPVAPEPEPPVVEAPVVEEGRRGRRRRDEQGGVSVAELLARAKASEEN
ncbi:hypothetical protein CATRI_11550 [Corynebacterium atrinae]|uniref:DUF6779 domain-containing protein n=1 Tax=Corynebacterium atrinae TaxID=1336740 RepID=UPI0025B49179|nr:DUF6779 domain-containing protein [Corynebacterium atrinae]WJY64359.1 hypothetical protein CATRI_11550 [Corynebacterium atrinae]